MSEFWPKAVVFDLDGTLIDSSPDVAAAATTALAPVGIRASVDEARGWLGDGARALVVKALREHDVVADEARVDELTRAFVAAYQAEPVIDTVPFPGAVAALAALRERGIGVAVCTNKPEDVARLVLDRTGLGPHVQTLAGGGGDYRLKPAPDGLLACVEALGATRSEAVYIGDHAVDMATARAAGVPVIAAEFGYAQEPVAELGADAVLQTWNDLETVLAAMAPENA